MVGYEPPSFDELARRYGTSIERYACRRLRSAESAEDVWQEVLLRAWLRPPVVTCEQQLRGWLFRVASNLVIDALRASAGRATVELRPVTEPVVTTDPTEAIAVRIGLAQLGRDERIVLLMRMSGYSLSDVGARLGISEEAARKRVARSCEKLHRLRG
jgi:RNA polymerase sigma-70 factor (ECF subfamily)